MDEPRTLSIALATTSDQERAALRSVLLAAQATELAELRRWGDRRAFGYGSDSARGVMGTDIERLQLRYDIISRLLDAVRAADGA